MYEHYCKARDAKMMKDADVARETGITKSTFSDWKSGRSVPKREKLQKIAQCLGVTVEFLEDGKEDSPERYYFNDETAAMAQELFENPELRVLFDAARDADPEDLKTAYDILIALKKKVEGRCNE